MRPFTLCVPGLLLAAAVASAHFVFVVPDKDGKSATVVFSDSLKPDENVPIEKVAGLKLTVRDAAGKDAAAEPKASEHALTAKLPGDGSRVVFGSVVYGVTARGKKAFLLSYHPKAIVGPVGERAALGKDAQVELIPVAKDGNVRLLFVAAGKPVAGAEVSLIKPDGNSAKMKTDKDGLTEALSGSGRFGAWVGNVETKSGEHDGKKYEEVRHYATLVFEK